MSYCRWSSMNHMCDVYVYEDVGGGWTTHVAGKRRAIPPIPDVPLMRLPRFGGTYNQEARCMQYSSKWRQMAARAVFGFWSVWHNRVHMVSLNVIPLRSIGLEHDGETFNDDTPAACADRLEMLRELGYKVPQYAIDALREENAEASA